MNVGQIGPHKEFAELLADARQVDERLSILSGEEDAARRAATDALNASTLAWNNVYACLIALKKEKSRGLRSSKLWDLLEKIPDR